MKLKDTKLRSLKASSTPYQLADGGGLYIEVLPSGKKVWRMRYRLHGRQERVTLGAYPHYSLRDARDWREEVHKQVAKGVSPARAKQAAKVALGDTVGAFYRHWIEEVVPRNNKRPEVTARMVEKDILPAIGKMPLTEVTPLDVLQITDRIKARGADQVALRVRGILKQLFGYAVAQHRMTSNPAAAVDAKYIATARARDVVLEPKEIGQLFRGIYASDLKRTYKLALHLLMITLVRKGELIGARWDEVNLDQGEWFIPGERMKMGRVHIVYLSRQALELLDELKKLACGSPYILPSRNDLKRHICPTTLNSTIRGLDFGIKPFVIHDFRRTGSTLLNEAGFNRDVVEKALAHEQGGVRGIYNRAQYADQRRVMLQWWADFVDGQIDDREKVVMGRFGRVGSHG